LTALRAVWWTDLYNVQCTMYQLDPNHQTHLKKIAAGKKNINCWQQQAQQQRYCCTTWESCVESTGDEPSAAAWSSHLCPWKDLCFVNGILYEAANRSVGQSIVRKFFIPTSETSASLLSYFSYIQNIQRKAFYSTASAN